MKKDISHTPMPKFEEKTITESKGFRYTRPTLSVTFEKCNKCGVTSPKYSQA